MYEQVDQSWRSRPMVIALETVGQADERIAEHARDHRVREVRVILHGGEPLLAGVLLRLEETRYDIGWPLHDCAHLGLQPDELGGLQPERIPALVPPALLERVLCQLKRVEVGRFLSRCG